jgi:hypothetical protein
MRTGVLDSVQTMPVNTAAVRRPFAGTQLQLLFLIVSDILGDRGRFDCLSERVPVFAELQLERLDTDGRGVFGKLVLGDLLLERVFDCRNVLVWLRGVEGLGTVCKVVYLVSPAFHAWVTSMFFCTSKII